MAFTRQLDVLAYQRPATGGATQVSSRHRLLQSLSTRASGFGAHLVCETTGLGDAGNVLLASGGLIEPKVVPVPLVTRPHLLHQAQQELDGGQDQRNVNVPGQVPSLGMPRRHPTRQRRMRSTAGSDRLQRRLRRCLSDDRKQIATSKEQPAQLRRNAEGQMPMSDVEQTALSLRRGLLRSGLPTEGTETALAGETERRRRPTIQATKASKPVGFGPAAQGFLEV